MTLGSIFLPNNLKVNFSFLGVPASRRYSGCIFFRRKNYAGNAKKRMPPYSLTRTKTCKAGIFNKQSLNVLQAELELFYKQSLSYKQAELEC